MICILLLSLLGLVLGLPRGEVGGKPPTCSCPTQFYFGSSGTIQSPNYPSNYCNNLKCTYTITGQTGKYLKLTFTHFDTELKNDIVALYDSNKADDKYNQIGNFSGPTGPAAAFVSGTNQLTVTFQTDDGTVASGFTASYSSVSSICGGSISTGSGGSGVIQSPDWGYNYPDNVDCVWTLTAPSGQRLRLSFSAKSQVEQNADFVVVTHDNQVVSFTGKNFQTVETVSNTMQVRFTSDSTVIKPGFQATYKAFTPTQDCTCGPQSRVLTSPNSNMMVNSPNFNHGGNSHNYCNNANCTWFLQVPDGYRVALTFNTFDLESGYDNVFIYDGVYGTRLQSCTNKVCPDTTSSGYQMTVQFVTDQSVSGQGFSSSFTATL